MLGFFMDPALPDLVKSKLEAKTTPAEPPTTADNGKN